MRPQGIATPPTASLTQFGAFLAAVALVVVAAGPPASAQPAQVYHIKGAASESNVAAAREAVDKIRLALKQSGDEGRPARIYVSGTFVLDAPINFSPENSGSLLSVEANSKAVFLSHGATPGTIMVHGGGDFRVHGLIIRNSTENGIYVKDAENVSITNVTVEDTASTGWSQGAIHLTGTVRGALVENNKVINSDYAGIIFDTTDNSDVSNVRILSNLLKDTCRVVKDCGSIYINDRGRRSKGIIISGNTIEGFGTKISDGYGIYLDDWASNVVVKGNSITGPGQYAFHIHGGRDNVIRENTIFLEEIFAAVRYIRATDGSRANMTGNVMAQNIFRAGKEGDDVHLPEDYRSGLGRLAFSKNKLCLRIFCVDLK